MTQTPSLEIELSKLEPMIKEIQVRAHFLKNYLGAINGLSDTSKDRWISGDLAYFFEIAQNAMDKELVLLTCALLERPKQADDATLWPLQEFFVRDGSVEALIANRQCDPAIVRRNVAEFVRKMDENNETELKELHDFRHKRLAHSTSKRFAQIR